MAPEPGCPSAQFYVGHQRSSWKQSGASQCKQFGCSGKVFDLDGVFEDSKTTIACKARFAREESLAVTHVKQRLLKASLLDCHSHDADFSFPVLPLLTRDAFITLDCGLSFAAILWQLSNERFHADLTGDGVNFVDSQIYAASFQQVVVLRIVQLSLDLSGPRTRRIYHHRIESCLL